MWVEGRVWYNEKLNYKKKKEKTINIINDMKNEERKKKNKIKVKWSGRCEDI